LGFVDHTHPAAAQLLDDVVMRDGLAKHWGEILGPGLGQVNEGVQVEGGSERRLTINPRSTHWYCVFPRFVGGSRSLHSAFPSHWEGNTPVGMTIPWKDEEERKVT
ncbi:MAG: hypothetical protein WBQ85_06990, partial [Candidatus Sulfotelmatobacter sp.]